MAGGGGARYWAVLPAAGGGSRMESRQPKQYLPVGDRRLLEHSLAPFLDAGWVDGVVVALAAGDETFRTLALARHWKIHTASGGLTRSDSVLGGLKRVAELARPGPVFVLVHDAARPGLRAREMQALRDAASDEHGGLLALPVADTLKRGVDARSVQTIDRRELWQAQTPQMFRLDLLRAAMENCKRRGVEVTDEAAAMEASGYKPRLVTGHPGNLKVTYPDDLATAAFWLSRNEKTA